MSPTPHRLRGESYFCERVALSSALVITVTAVSTYQWEAHDSLWTHTLRAFVTTLIIMGTAMWGVARRGLGVGAPPAATTTTTDPDDDDVPPPLTSSSSNSSSEDAPASSDANVMVVDVHASHQNLLTFINGDVGQVITGCRAAFEQRHGAKAPQGLHNPCEHMLLAVEQRADDYNDAEFVFFIGKYDLCLEAVLWLPDAVENGHTKWIGYILPGRLRPAAAAATSDEPTPPTS